MSFQAQIRRVVKCSPERAYALWTDPELLKQWFCPKDFPSEVEMDAKPGGSIRIVMHFKPDDYYGLTCKILRMDPPKQFAFTWQWDESSFDPGVSEVEVFFDPVPGGTAVTLKHTKLASEVSVDRHGEGWGQVLNRFEESANTLEEMNT